MAVITFDVTGNVEFTRKPELLGLFDGERKQIDRMTDILHHAPSDRYYFRFLTGPYAGRNFDTKVYSEVNLRYGGIDDCIEDLPPVATDLLLLDKALYSVWSTATYEECAKLEVWFVDWMRRILGVSMAGGSATL